MRKERILSIITTIYFFLYCILMSIFGIILIDTGYNFNQITDVASDSILESDGILFIFKGFFSMFGVFGQVMIGLLVAITGIIWILCIGIFIHSCFCLRKNQTSDLERKRLTRDSFIKILFLIFTTLLNFSVLGYTQIYNVQSVIIFFIMIGIPFLLCLITLISCAKKKK